QMLKTRRLNRLKNVMCYEKISYYPFLSMISAVVKNHEIDTELPRKILTLQTMSLAFIKVSSKGISTSFRRNNSCVINRKYFSILLMPATVFTHLKIVTTVRND
ncbi:hypothetical protein, partial [uncultured Duncaniella sp.]|uniref:hypothetical protein n=1 Tax=uncultured Duncaniella sp. TaxID=2768039 RepID=UPI0025B645FD